MRVSRNINEEIAVAFLSLDGDRRSADQSIDWLSALRDEETMKAHDANVAILDQAISNLVVYAVACAVEV